MNKRTYMFIGARPDDVDTRFAGTCILLRRLGHDVVFVSLTDGSAGHQAMGRNELATCRNQEAQAVAQFLGIRYIVMDSLDGQLTADIPMRHKIINLIRTIKPDVIIAHRPSDYHPDHRAAAQLVADSSFLVTVPLICPETNYLEQAPFILYAPDAFKKPTAFMPEIIVDITPVIDEKMQSLALVESQFFEWLPFVLHIDEPVPTSGEERIEFCKRYWGNRGGTAQYLSLLDDADAKYCEAFERCEYGAKVTEEIAQELFPFAKLNFATAVSQG